MRLLTEFGRFAAGALTIFVTWSTGPVSRNSAIPECDRKCQLVGIGCQMLHRHVRIATHHRIRLPAPQLLNYPGGHIILPEPACPGVPQIMSADVRDPVGLPCRTPCSIIASRRSRWT